MKTTDLLKKLEQQRKANKRKQDRAELYQSLVFCSWLMLIWLGHLITGWFRWLFFPKGWTGQLKDIESGWGIHQYDNDSDLAITKLRENNKPEDKVMLVRRIHPIYLDTELLYVYSPKYKVRIWDGEIKEL